ncbi:MAG: DegT/DnrJ/EryC1/StrS aminotransferase family protein [candidate division WOR-3 bacterium]|nr:DegT/DnrJ/EryC1/StrS aminotransferase family protein [candidate division WOR-3 bacterium]MDW8150348.1 DegT/DnrJ/EryC1/StrS aminotransferase family protein [candidate division WOR-3 bacterium]
MRSYKVPFYRHSLNEEDIQEVVKVLNSPNLTTAEKNEEFESMFSKYLGVNYCLTVNSCTAGLHLSILALNLKPDEKVIVPAMSFMATANAVLMAKREIVFVDVDRETGLIDLNMLEDKLKKDSKIRVVIVVHLYGQMVSPKDLLYLKEKYGFYLIEDSAHCIEGERDGYKPGFGDFACFSFYATKNITCGEGGAIVFNDSNYLDKLKLLRLHGLDRRKDKILYDMELLGWKYNLTNFQSAMLISQLKRIDKLWERRRQIYEKYKGELEKLSIKMPKIYGKSAYHLFIIFIENRNEIIKKLNDMQVEVSIHYPKPIPLLKFYRENFKYNKSEFKNALWISEHALSLPFYPSMSNEDMSYVIDALKISLNSSV